MKDRDTHPEVAGGNANDFIRRISDQVAVWSERHAKGRRPYLTQIDREELNVGLPPDAHESMSTAFRNKKEASIASRVASRGLRQPTDHNRSEEKMMNEKSIARRLIRIAGELEMLQEEDEGDAEVYDWYEDLEDESDEIIGEGDEMLLDEATEVDQNVEGNVETTVARDLMASGGRVAANVRPGDEVVIQWGGIDDGETGVVVNPRALKLTAYGVPVDVQGAYKMVNKDDVVVRLEGSGNMVLGPKRGVVKVGSMKGKERRAGKWQTLPKGWDKGSLDQYWESLTGDVKHKVTKCIKKMKDEPGIDDAGAFCAALADRVLGTTEWRGASIRRRGSDANLHFGDAASIDEVMDSLVKNMRDMASHWNLFHKVKSRNNIAELLLRDGTGVGVTINARFPIGQRQKVDVDFYPINIPARRQTGTYRAGDMAADVAQDAVDALDEWVEVD